MAIAGAGRIFELLDEQPEADDGDVTLVRCRKNADGSLTDLMDRQVVIEGELVSVDLVGNVAIVRETVR